jgi:hypothetical protein
VTVDFARATRVPLLVALVMVLSGCWIFGNAQIELFYRPSGGASIVAVIHEEPTDQLEGGNEVFAMDDEVKFLTFLRGQIVLGDDLRGQLAAFAFAASDFNYFFDNQQAGDFGEAINNIKNNRRCLAMDRNPTATGDRHNWTYREASDSHCHVGQPFPIG